MRNKPISQWKLDGKLPAISDALEFRREQYGWTKEEMAEELGIGYTHYTEILKGIRHLSRQGMKKAYDIGIPGAVLLQK